MTAEEKDDSPCQLIIRTIRKSEFAVLKIGPNKGEKVPHELCELLAGAQPH